MRQIFAAVAVGAVLLPGAAAACAQLTAFAVDSLLRADIILVGEVTGFERVSEAPGAALVTVRVSEAIKGGAGAEMVLIWNDGGAMGPSEARARGRVVIGAMATGRASATMVTDLRPDLPMIAQPFCGDVWMQPATPDMVAAVHGLTAP